MPARYGIERGELERTPPEARLRIIADASYIRGKFNKDFFAAFFPDTLPIKPFNRESVGHPKQVELSKIERQIRGTLLEYLGYKSLRKNPVSHGDIPALHVGFTNNPDSIVTVLNNHPSIRRQEGIAQTECGIMFMPADRRKALELTAFTLFQHANHMAWWSEMTNLRLAIQQPDLYLARNAKDMEVLSQEYERMFGTKRTFETTPSSSVWQAVDQAIKLSDIDIGEKDSVFREALAVAMQNGKLFELYARAHDMESPGWKDTVMRAIDLDEDALLVSSIDRYIDKDPGLRSIIEEHGLDAELVRVAVKSWASQNSPTLGGYLMKDKRKYRDDQRKEYDFLPQEEAWDSDQESGIVTNGADVINRYLPGGFRHLKRGDALPVGSFIERLRLLAFCIVTGLPKEELRKKLEDFVIDPESVFIASEEISVWPNVVLREYRVGEKSEILPVSLAPGDVKRAIEMFHALYAYHYRRVGRVSAEVLTQDVIRFGLGAGTMTRDMFRLRTDLEVAQRMEEVAPALVWFQSDIAFCDCSRVVSQGELVQLAQNDGTIADTLIIRLNEYEGIINEKPGTLVVDDEGNIHPYQSVLSKKRGGGISDCSLPARQKAMKQVLQDGPWFMLVTFTDEQKQTLQSLLPAGKLDDPVRKTIRLWTEPIVLYDKTITPTIRAFFLTD